MLSKYIWKWFKKPLTAYYVSAQNNPMQLADLEYAFTTTNGTRYYRFPNGIQLPMERYAKLQQYMVWISSALDGTELGSLLDLADKAIVKGLEDTKEAARVAAIIGQIRDRNNKIHHIELMYNYLAVQFVREDEAPTVFNNQIQMEKVMEFREDAETQNQFFFLLPEYKKLIDLLNMSEGEWTTYLEVFQAETEKLSASLRILSSKE